MSDSPTPWTAARQASLSITNSQSLLKLIESTEILKEIRIINNHITEREPLNFVVYFFLSNYFTKIIVIAL